MVQVGPLWGTSVPGCHALVGSGPLALMRSRGSSGSLSGFGISFLYAPEIKASSKRKKLNNFNFFVGVLL